MYLRHRDHLAAAVATTALITAIPLSAHAFCGFYVAGSEADLVNKATMVVMMREGTRTVLAMQNDYEGPPENFAMVVPVPVVLQEENVKTLDKEVFRRVETLASPRLVEYWEQDPCMQMMEEEADMAVRAGAMPSPPSEAAAQDDLGVRIEAQFTVAEYEIVILSASDSSGLETWLRRNEYSIPDGAGELLRPYVEAGMKFFVAKVDVTKVHFEDGKAMLSPLRFHYDSDEFSLPVRLGLLNSSGTQDLIVHILAPSQRYEVANYPNVTIPTNINVANGVRERFGEFYAALFDATIEHNPRAVVTEYAWQASNCDPCPGPVLDASDLMTLGADVLPGTAGGSRVATVSMLSSTVDGDIPQPVVEAILSSESAGLTGCYQTALGRNTSLAGAVQARITVGAAGSVTGSPVVTPSGARDAQAEVCMAAVLSTLRFPPPRSGQATVTASMMLSSAVPNEWEVQSRLMGFVLTRLHARYSKEALGDDLVFRPTNPIVGGREFVQTNGKLEEGSQPSDINNFQARYAIRHAWEGPMACASPRRGIWGGPPSGIEGGGVRPALDLAFAPRGNVRLPDLVAQDVPELGLRAAAATQPFTPTSTTGQSSSSTGSGGGCGSCAATGTGAGAPLGMLAFLGVLGVWMSSRRKS